MSSSDLKASQKKVADAASKAKPVSVQGKELLPPPPFTMGDLRRAIPAHCFERSAIESTKHLLVDLAICGSLFVAATYIPTTFENPLARAAAWLLYWVAQGTAGVGVWVIAHECGHQAYSDSGLINDAVGFVLHSALLVPYFPWKYSHGMHHKGTHHLERDQVFVPPSKETKSITAGGAFEEAINESPMASLVGLFLMLTVGWPGYLLANFSGQDYGRRTNHFEPSSPIFKEGQGKYVLASDVGIIAVIYGLYQWSQALGFWSMFSLYLAPYLIVNMWLVSYTFLHHSHGDLPYYRGEDWTFIRGALSTVDRDYTPLCNWMHHHIGDTHVVHHLFSTMPHYHAVEATEAIKGVLGDYYKVEHGFPLTQLYRTWRQCRAVERVEHPAVGTQVFVYRGVKTE